jgi:uncharacterized protein involved in exopolysaccharide biosynthesis
MNIENSYLNKETISFSEIINQIKANKISLLSITLLTGLIFYSATFLMSDKYRSEALLKTNSKISSEGINSNYGAFASLAGISLNQNIDSDKSILAIEVIKSRDFYNHILNLTNVKEKIYKSNLDFDNNHEFFIRNLITINKDKNTGYIRLTATHTDAIFAKNLIELIVNQINNQLREKDLTDSTNAIKYLNEQYFTNTLTNMKSSINKLIEDQLQVQMLSNVRKDYIFSYIDRPYVPMKKTSPIGFIYLFLGLFFGLSMGLIYIFAKNLLFKN